MSSLSAGLRFASALVVPSEGFSTTAYLDTVAKPPIWTIGHGTTVIDGKPVCQGMTCTAQEAMQWAAAGMVDAAMCVSNHVVVPLSDQQLGALTSFCYNIGNGAFARSDVLRALNHGFYRVAADRLLEYDHAGGVVVRGLTTRRARERALFLQGTAAIDHTIWPEHPSADDLNQAEIDRLHHETTSET